MDSLISPGPPLSETSFILSHPSLPEGLATPAVVARPSEPTQSAVILCHGFLSDKNSRTNRRVTELLVPQGIATLRFDWFGMGESPQQLSHLSLHTCLQQLNSAFLWLTDQGFQRLGLMGSSFGGLIALLSAPHHTSLAALALKCPVVDFPEVLRLEFGQDALEDWKQHHRIPDILGGTTPIPLQFSFYEECLNHIGYSSASGIHAPTLTVHGAQDDLIPLHQIHRLQDSLAGEKRLDLIPGADHRFGQPEDFRVMTSRLSQWMVDHLRDP